MCGHWRGGWRRRTRRRSLGTRGSGEASGRGRGPVRERTPSGCHAARGPAKSRSTGGLVEGGRSRTGGAATPVLAASGLPRSRWRPRGRTLGSGPPRAPTDTSRPPAPASNPSGIALRASRGPPSGQTPSSVGNRCRALWVGRHMVASCRLAAQRQSSGVAASHPSRPRPCRIGRGAPPAQPPPTVDHGRMARPRCRFGLRRRSCVRQWPRVGRTEGAGWSSLTGRL